MDTPIPLRLLPVLMILAVCGCQVDGTSFQMDSISRVPIFGMEVLPKKKPERDYRTIRHTAPRTVELAESGSPPAKSGWPSWLTPFAKPSSMPLPRTDLELPEEPVELAGTPLVEGFGF